MQIDTVANRFWKLCFVPFVANASSSKVQHSITTQFSWKQVSRTEQVASYNSYSFWSCHGGTLLKSLKKEAAKVIALTRLGMQGALNLYIDQGWCTGAETL
eukprot:scaffold337874_cov43-Prasinocladus_malaysianus.AAC.1